MKRRGNSITEQNAVNAVRHFFESNGCVFQLVNTANDYGKDAYLDLAEGERITGLCAALQIKGGVSYRRADGSYFIPLDEKHAKIWREATLPILGLVHDPDDGWGRWCSISDFVNQGHNTTASYIPVPRDAILDVNELHSLLRSTVLSGSRIVRHPLIQVLSEDDDVSESAVLDCFALGRSEARIFIGLRYLLRAIDKEVVRAFIYVLAHLTPHPDVFWHSGNWIPQEVKRVVQPHLSWEQDKILRLLQSIEADEYERGGMGQSLYMLFVQDANIADKMKDVAVQAANLGDEEAANVALYFHLYWLGENASEHFAALLASHANLRSLLFVPIYRINCETTVTSPCSDT